MALSDAVLRWIEVLTAARAIATPHIKVMENFCDGGDKRGGCENQVWTGDPLGLSGWQWLRLIACLDRAARDHFVKFCKRANRRVCLFAPVLGGSTCAATRKVLPDTIAFEYGSNGSVLLKSINRKVFSVSRTPRRP